MTPPGWTPTPGDLVVIVAVFPEGEFASAAVPSFWTRLAGSVAVYEGPHPYPEGAGTRTIMVTAPTGALWAVHAIRPPTPEERAAYWLEHPAAL